MGKIEERGGEYVLLYLTHLTHTYEKEPKKQI